MQLRLSKTQILHKNLTFFELLFPIVFYVMTGTKMPELTMRRFGTSGT